MLPAFPVKFATNSPAWARGANLWLDFEANTGRYDGAQITSSIVALTRASTEYAPTRGGVYLPFSNNVLARTDDGLQVAPGRTQLLSSVTDLTTTWSAVNSTVAASAVPAFNAVDTLQLVTSSNANGNRVQQNSPALSNGATYCQVFEMRAGSSNFGGIVAKGVSTLAGAIFNLATGSVVSTAGTNAVSAAIVRSYNGNWLCSLIFTAAAAEVVQPGVGVSDGSTYAFTVFPSAASGTVYAGIGNLYLGSFAVPPILSAATTATDVATITLPAGRLDAGVGGFIQFDPLYAQFAGDFRRVLSITNGTNNDGVNGMRIYRNGATQMALDAWDASVAQANLQATRASLGTPSTYAFSYGSNYVNFRKVGAGAVTADTSTTIPTGLININFGTDGVGGNAGYQFNNKAAFFFGPQNADTFAAIYAQAVLAAAA